MNELLIHDADTLLWNEIARDILSNNLCHYKFAYDVALYHARIDCELDDKNVVAWGYYLDIGTNRTKILNDSETKSVANRILELDPSNIKGKSYSN